ncbi:MAG: putative ATP-dependent endonuclease of OLD family [Polaribacter sp.]|jgi:putative ATP-dependent endonuclease of OLD family
MYISNVYIKNYKSLKNVNFKLHKGKNVIVGKNNSGKSNIITALDILFGNKNPTYREYDENDYHTYSSVDSGTGEIKENVSDYFYIQAELEGKDFNQEELAKIKKKTSFSVINKPKDVLDKDNGYIDYSFFSNLDELETSDKVSKIPEERDRKVKWFDKTNLISLLENSQKVLVFFCKDRKNDNSGFGIIIVDNDRKCWISHFLRNELKNSIVTTAIIPAFRNPKDELRLVHYTWYGKLIKTLWDNGKDVVEEEINKKSEDIKRLADKVFDGSTTELRELLQKAISHKNVSFKLLPSQKNDIYKNVQIYVDDGIDRPLDKKGSGIQSAIIISLFTTYCRTFHKSSSLLVTEEPELFLHPQARRVISSELEKYLGDCDSNQLIVSTHSIEFLKNTPIQNVIVANKLSETNETIVTQISYDAELTKEETNKIIRFIWSKNTEIFFSDKVLLVEGGEEYLLPSIFDKILNKKQVLDYENASIARVDGKGNFLTYIKILDRFKIPWLILGDLDCYDDVLRDLMKYTELDISKLEYIKSLFTKTVSFKKIKKEVIKNSTSNDGYILADLFSKIKKEEISINDPSVISFITYLEERFSKSNFQEELSKESELLTEFNLLQKELQSNNIYILPKGAIESYYTEQANNIDAKGKDNKALEVANEISLPENTLGDYINDYSLFEDILKKLTTPDIAYKMESSAG